MGNYTLITVSLENIKQDQDEVVFSFDSLSQLLEEVRQKNKSHQKFYWVSLVDPTQDDLSLLDVGDTYSACCLAYVCRRCRL